MYADPRLTGEYEEDAAAEHPRGIVASTRKRQKRAGRTERTAALPFQYAPAAQEGNQEAEEAEL